MEKKSVSIPQKLVNLCKSYAHSYAHADVQMLCTLTGAVCGGREVTVGAIMWSGATEKEVREIARMVKCKQFANQDERKVPFPTVKEK